MNKSFEIQTVFIDLQVLGIYLVAEQNSIIRLSLKNCLKQCLPNFFYCDLLMAFRIMIQWQAYSNTYMHTYLKENLLKMYPCYLLCILIFLFQLPKNVSLVLLNCFDNTKWSWILQFEKYWFKIPLYLLYIIVWNSLRLWVCLFVIISTAFCLINHSYFVVILRHSRKTGI